MRDQAVDGQVGIAGGGGIGDRAVLDLALVPAQLVGAGKGDAVALGVVEEE